MTPVPGVRLRDRAAYLRESNTLVLADLHLGRARTAGIEAPLTAAVRIRPRLVALLERYRPDRVVIAGDVLDAFEGLPTGVSERFERLLEAIETAGAAPVVLRGNHDTVLSAAFAGEIETRWIDDGTLVCHGHELPGEPADRYVIGHEHPAIRIEGAKRPCYLYCPDGWNGAEVLVLPAFSRLLRGTAMNNRAAADCHTPLLRADDLGRYRPIVRDESADETFAFPRLGALRRFL